MILAACGNEDEKAEFLGTLKEWIESSEMKNPAYLVNVYKEVGIKLIEALYDFENGEYDEVVDALYPIRHKFIRVGGSHAQRDLLQLILIYSALNSNKGENKTTGELLLRERMALKPNSCLTKRIAHKLSLDDTF